MRYFAPSSHFSFGYDFAALEAYTSIAAGGLTLCQGGSGARPAGSDPLQPTRREKCQAALV
jgi:hypothetical protein